MPVIIGLMVLIVALMVFFKPIRYLGYIGLFYLGFLFVQDIWSEETLTEGPSGYTWNIGNIEKSPSSPDSSPVYEISGTLYNNTQGFIESFKVKTTLYACPSDESPLDDCRGVKVDMETDGNDVPADFAHQFKVRAHFMNVGHVNNPRVMAEVQEVVADSDLTL